MNAHSGRISEAFQRNGIERVLIVDDGYDPPPMDDGVAGALADIFGGDKAGGIRADLEIDQRTWDRAAEAATDGDLESDALDDVYRAMYRQFALTRDKDLDPGGRFDGRKGRALDELLPLCCLLQGCGKQMEVRTVGLDDAIGAYSQWSPQVVFLDYYLDSSLGDSELGDAAALTSARGTSLGFLQELIAGVSIEDMPAVVLISTRRISDVDEYRHAVAGRAMMALRFGFLQKRTIRKSGNRIEIEHEAADVLLDTSQGFLLGRAVQGALHKWKTGAESALESFVKEINDLHTRDFAYLLRFRLREEGQALDEYLVWLFGEALRGLIEGSVDWDDLFRNLDPEIHEGVEGALEGRTQAIAQLFHRARINTNRVQSGGDYRLGDLFVSVDEHCALVVITPDCDLVTRNSSPDVKSVLTMGGDLRTFDQPKSAADDFVIIRDRPYSVWWNPKDLRTFPISGGGGLRESYEFIGTLRPLYAQEAQRRALVDLSRVGLPVAPALGVQATARVWMKKWVARFMRLLWIIVWRRWSRRGLASRAGIVYSRRDLLSMNYSMRWEHWMRMSSTLVTGTRSGTYSNLEEEERRTMRC